MFEHRFSHHSTVCSSFKFKGFYHASSYHYIYKLSNTSFCQLHPMHTSNRQGNIDVSNQLHEALDNTMTSCNADTYSKHDQTMYASNFFQLRQSMIVLHNSIWKELLMVKIHFFLHANYKHSGHSLKFLIFKLYYNRPMLPHSVNILKYTIS